jgi:hypothetical protein
VGKQVNFFMYGTDEDAFLAAARQRGELYILRYTSPNETFEVLTDLPPSDEPGSFQVWLWDRSVCKPPVVSWVEQQRYYTIDRFASEVIEFNRSYEREGRLVRGRIWAEFATWQTSSPQVVTEKSLAFRKWFDSLAGWIKRRYTRTPDGWYMGPKAREFQQRGGHFLELDFAPVVKLVRH